MIFLYVILAVVLWYIDFGFQNAGLSATVPIILLVAVLYRISKLMELIKEEKEARERLDKKDAAQKENEASGEA